MFQVLSHLSHLCLAESQEPLQVPHSEIPYAFLHLLLILLESGHDLHIVNIGAVLDHVVLLELPASLPNVEFVVEGVVFKRSKRLFRLHQY